MAFARATRTLGRSCRAVGDRLGELRVTLVEDRPEGVTPAIVSRREEAIEDLRQLATEAANDAAAAGAAHDVANGWLARRRLVACHERLYALACRFRGELDGTERQTELLSLGRERGGEWLAWSQAVRRALEETGDAIERAEGTLLESWRDLADYAVWRAEEQRETPVAVRGATGPRAITTQGEHNDD